VKAFQLVGGSPDLLETVALATVPQPDPGPGQVLVRIGGAGACHSDVTLMEFAAQPRATPMTLGHENAGWIEAFGPGTLPTAGLEVGTPVAVYGAWGCGQWAVQELPPRHGKLLPHHLGQWPRPEL
jgi:propanol-preferring alcohol dehydrogenase